MLGDYIKNSNEHNELMTERGEGFNINDLENIRLKTMEMGAHCDLYELGGENDLPEAFFLVIRNGVDILSGECNFKNKLFEEQLKFQYDKKTIMYGRVVNKNARWNLCFYNKDREPDYENGKGRIIGYDKVPFLKKIKDEIEKVVGVKAEKLKVESNYYYDVDKCGIGFHGDTERRKVIGMRLGDVGIPIYYQWFQNSKPVGGKLKVELNVGDIYIMCEKAVGTDYKSRKIFTLRHAVGCKSFTNLDKYFD